MGLQKCGVSVNRAFKELQAHGSLEFPCAGYSEIYTSQPKYIVPWHWHEELEISHPKKGKLKLQIPGKTYELEEGDCFITNSNVLHYAEAVSTCELQSLVFAPTLITGSRESVFAQKYILPLIDASPDGFLLRAEEHKEQVSAFISAFEALKSDVPGFEFIVRENLSRICFFLYQQFESKIRVEDKRPHQDHLRTTKMLDYIHNHFAENISLTEIAKVADIGERECLRCFQRTIQLSPMQYLLKYRIMRGADLLLQNPASSISEIAGLCGFDSPSNFAKMFKRFYNTTPREYRKLERI